MIPRIETLKETKLVGKWLTMSFSKNRTTELWQSFMPGRKEIKNSVSSDLFSLEVYPNGFFKNFDPAEEFKKWAAVEVSDFINIPGDMDTITLPGGLYAVFLYKGLASNAAATYEYIFRTWLPASAFSLDTRPHFALMGEKYKRDDSSSEEEIWIPIKESAIASS